MNIGVVIVAGGQGNRLGALAPKAFVELAGKPLFAHSYVCFQNHPEISEVVLVAPADYVSTLKSEGYNVVSGGSERQHSVLEGIKNLSPKCEWVLVHDAARPFVTSDVISALVVLARKEVAAIAATPIVDTVKWVEGERVSKTVDRKFLWSAQTPQSASRSVLQEGLSKAQQDGLQVTDEAALLEFLGVPVQVVDAGQLNFKITTPQDLILAEQLLKRS